MRVCMGVVCKCVVLVYAHGDVFGVFYIGLIVMSKHVCLLECELMLADDHLNAYTCMHTCIHTYRQTICVCLHVFAQQMNACVYV